MNHLHQGIKWQQEASSISDRLWDVVIVGAGPARAKKYAVTACCRMLCAVWTPLVLAKSFVKPVTKSAPAF
jgi:hypothetical protein